MPEIKVRFKTGEETIVCESIVSIDGQPHQPQDGVDQQFEEIARVLESHQAAIEAQQRQLDSIIHGLAAGANAGANPPTS